MIVCQCNALSERDIQRTVAAILAADADVAVTPGRVVRALGVRRQCSGCLRTLTDIVGACSAECDRAACPRRRAGATEFDTSTQLNGEAA